MCTKFPDWRLRLKTWKVDKLNLNGQKLFLTLINLLLVNSFYSSSISYLSILAFYSSILGGKSYHILKFRINFFYSTDTWCHLLYCNQVKKGIKIRLFWFISSFLEGHHKFMNKPNMNLDYFYNYFFFSIYSSSFSSSSASSSSSSPM